MYNAVYSIYCVYIALMNIINTTDEDSDEKWLDYKDNYTLHLLRKLNKFNYDSAFRLPYLSNAVKNQVAYEHQTGPSKVVLLKQHALLPTFKCDCKNLNADLINDFENTWALNETLGYVHNSQFFYQPISTTSLEPAQNPR